MPIYEIKCRHCGYKGEIFVLSPADEMVCPNCGRGEIEKLLSLPSSLTGRAGRQMPGPADHGCCGVRPAEASCAGPGSCCGKTGGR